MYEKWTLFIGGEFSKREGVLFHWCRSVQSGTIDYSRFTQIYNLK